jgi:hypothetical protein
VDVEATCQPTRDETTTVTADRRRSYLDPGRPLHEFRRGPEARAAKAASGPLRVVRFNIAYAVHIERALDVLQGSEPVQDPDVLALQEMDAPGTERIANALGMNAVYFPSGVHPKHKRDFGCAVLSPWPLAEARKLVLPHGARGSGLRRAAAVATVVRGAQRIRGSGILQSGPAPSGPIPALTAGRSRLKTEGYLNVFDITTDWGPLEAEGETMLLMRLHEVRALAQLDEVSKSEVFLKSAGTSADAEREGVFFAESAGMLARFHKSTPVAAVLADSRALVAKTKDGRAVALLPVDWVQWTAASDKALTEVEKRAKAELGATKLELRMTGTMSAVAKKEMAARGRMVTENVPVSFEVAQAQAKSAPKK